MKQVKKILYLLGVILVPIALLFLCTLIVTLVLMVLPEKLGFAIPENMIYHMNGAFGTLIAAVICVWHVKRKKYSECAKATEKLQMGKAFGVMLFSVCVCKILWSGLTSPILSYLLPQTETAVTTSTSTDFINIAIAILVAPVAEELLFRKGIYCMLRNKAGRVTSVIMCAVAFALLHGYQLEGILSCLVASIVFTLIYDTTGNVVYSILAHMACNISATVTNALERAKVTWFGLPVQYEMGGYNMYHVGLIILAAALCGIGLVVCYKKKCSGAIALTN